MKPEDLKSFEDRTAENKPKWGPGPWQREPDRVEFEHEGFPCLMSRVPNRGHWCGYVGVPPGHPWHGEKNYFWERPDGPEVHGGVTYGEECFGTICHVPKAGEPENLWWIGFDCAHSGDLSPADLSDPLRLRLSSHEVYRDANYVRDHVERLAEQAKAAG